MTNNSKTIARGFLEIIRIWREGGVANVAFPDRETGELLWRKTDKWQAEEIVAWLLDRLIADLRRREKAGELLSDEETTTLRLWREEVPHAYTWSAPRGGPSLLTTLNSFGVPVGEQSNNIVLAAHPTEYDIGWIVPKAGRSPDFHGYIRLNPNEGGLPIFIARLDFPPEVGRLWAWARFDHLNVEKMIRRLSPRDHRRFLLPYGALTFPDGRQVLFNRNYEPIYERWLKPGPEERRWFYNDAHAEPEARRRAEAALELFLAGKPLPPDWHEETATADLP